MSSVERLSAEDRLILWPDEVWPQDIGALGVLDGSSLLDSGGRFRIEAARRALEGRLHLLRRFRQVLYLPRRGLGGPLWVDAPAFDLSDHVRVERLHAPADEAELLRAVARLRRRRLDRSRPLWEIWFLTGLPADRIGMFVRLHHVVADGIAGVAELGALLDAAPSSTMASAQPWAPERWPSARALLLDNLQRQIAKPRRAFRSLRHPAAILHRARAAMPAVRELLAGKPGPRTSLNRVIGQDRTLALVRSSLELVNEVAHTHDAKVNDVLLAVITGGLRGLLRARGEPIEGVILPIYVPVSLRRGRSGQEAGNLISQMIVPLHLGIADPAQRLRQIAVETAKRKAISRPSLGTMFGNRLLRGAMLKLIARQRVNVVSADLPGPDTPLYFAGAQLIEVFPLLNLLGNESLGVGALSYAGQFNVMAVADADAYPDIDVFAASARDDLRALVESTERARGWRSHPERAYQVPGPT
ncbi:MAG TPA: wax ester/triacylglycerol synthase domain-containing protein [Propionibacteriaceae bacterium]